MRIDTSRPTKHMPHIEKKFTATGIRQMDDQMSILPVKPWGLKQFEIPPFPVFVICVKKKNTISALIPTLNPRFPFCIRPSTEHVLL